MPRVYFVHWNQQEAEARAAELAAAGHEVRVQWSGEQGYSWGDYVPDAVLISLDRLPSHGRAVAEWVWGAKKRQGIPIVFAGGKDEARAEFKEQFPAAAFCAADAAATVVTRVIENR
jgi:hypothetical protein